MISETHLALARPSSAACSASGFTALLLRLGSFFTTSGGVGDVGAMSSVKSSAKLIKDEGLRLDSRWNTVPLPSDFRLRPRGGMFRILSLQDAEHRVDGRPNTRTDRFASTIDSMESGSVLSQDSRSARFDPSGVLQIRKGGSRRQLPRQLFHQWEGAAWASPTSPTISTI